MPVPRLRPRLQGCLCLQPTIKTPPLQLRRRRRRLLLLILILILILILLLLLRLLLLRLLLRLLLLQDYLRFAMLAALLPSQVFVMLRLLEKYRVGTRSLRRVLSLGRSRPSLYYMLEAVKFRDEPQYGNDHDYRPGFKTHHLLPLRVYTPTHPPIHPLTKAPTHPPTKIGRAHLRKPKSLSQRFGKAPQTTWVGSKARFVLRPREEKGSFVVETL